ncbi:MAG: DUF4189 domain-containing protein [Rhodobacteraceae bacterium]|nr:DUF4189 domain-containing protein [Paracoccaceae bacterium]
MRSIPPVRAALAALLFGFAAPVSAGECGYDFCWGAVAIGPDGEWGYAYDRWSEEDAYNTAQEGCGWGCTTVKTFYNSCGAIAVASNGAWGFGREWNRELAESTAVNWCMDNGRNCQTRVWACSR